jgi:hypothetical protein
MGFPKSSYLRRKESTVSFSRSALFCLLFMLLSLGMSTANEGTEYEDTNRTSKVKNFGVGGWFDGRDCPGIELLWKFKKNADSPNAFFRMKDGKTIILDRGMAIFSPDCKHFWFTPYDGGKIKVFETASGKLVSSFTGYYPAWSPNSKIIYMSRRGAKTWQLWSWTLSEGEKGPLLGVWDYCTCYPPGESVVWHPVKFDAEGNVVWTYPFCDKITRESGVPSGRVITADPSSWEIKNIQIKDLACDG